MDNFGKELILDIHECDPSLFTRENIEKFFIELCELIDMERCDFHFWDYKDCPEEYEKAPAHLKGTSAIQFITTSNITIHTLDELKRVYLNIFSCKNFNGRSAVAFTSNWFKGTPVKSQVIERI